MLEYRVVNLQEQLNMADTYFKNLDDDSKKKYVSQVLERCKQVWGVDELYEIEDESGRRALGHNASTMKMWFSRPSMPWDFILTTAIRRNVSLDYLLMNINENTNLEDVRPEELLETVNKVVASSLEESADYGIIDPTFVPTITKKIKTSLEGALTIKAKPSKSA